MSDTIKLSRRSLMLGASLAAATYASACSKSPQVGAVNRSDTKTFDSANLSANDVSADLTGVSILITGSSSGFGRLGAEHYARLGAKVFATMRNLPRPEAQELETLAKSEALDITVLEIDVTNDDQVKAGVSAALRAAGGKLGLQFCRTAAEPMTIVKVCSRGR